MDRPSHHIAKAFNPSVSPYLLQPLRTYEQALADIAAARRSVNVVTPFVPKDHVSGPDKPKPRIAA